MGEKRVTRRLAAIVAADVVGYSRLMRADETGTLAQLKAHRAELVDPKVAEHHGRIVMTAGDGMLTEYPSVVDAVRCAVEVQDAMAGRNAGLAEDRRMLFRVGINLGDIIVEGDDIYGDGVNIAARLEQLAEPGGICVSEAVFTDVRNKIDLMFEDLGAQTVKNIPEPVRSYRIKLGRDHAKALPSQAEGAEEEASPPAIAVLPFNNMSGDAEQEYFADGLTEDIITAISGWPSFPVIARNSTFAYKGQSPDVRQVAEDLGARYVLEGSVRKAGNRVRITAQLIDAANGIHVWAERFDRDLADIFDLQDEITQRIAATLEPELERAEQKKSAAKRPANLGAWDLYHRGAAQLYEFSKEGNVRAREYFGRAIELDPRYAQAHLGIAYSYHRDILMEQTDDLEGTTASLLEVSRRAVELDDASSMAHTIHGCAYMWAGQHDLGIAEARRAIAINPNNFVGYVALGLTLDFAGRSREATAEIEKGLTLNPQDPRNYLYYYLLARAHLNAGNYEEAIAWARDAIQRRSDYLYSHLVLVASLGHLERTEEARAMLEECERARPGFAASQVAGLPYRHAADNARMRDGLMKAGLGDLQSSVG